MTFMKNLFDEYKQTKKIKTTSSTDLARFLKSSKGSRKARFKAEKELKRRRMKEMEMKKPKTKTKKPKTKTTGKGSLAKKAMSFDKKQYKPMNFTEKPGFFDNKGKKNALLSDDSDLFKL